MTKKIDIIFLVYIVTFYVCTQVFVEKITFCVVCTKKPKKCTVRSRVTTSKFVFFIGATEKNFFFWKFVYQHKMSRFICKNLVYNFLILRNVNSHNGCKCSYEPKCISPNKTASTSCGYFLLPISTL
jgi:hypothetical protein